MNAAHGVVKGRRGPVAAAELLRVGGIFKAFGRSAAVGRKHQDMRTERNGLADVVCHQNHAAWMPAADLAGSPLLFITYPLPKIVVLPVFFTLVGLGDASRVLLIALTTGYQVLVIIRAGALSIDPSWVKAFRSMGGTTAEAVRHLYVPAALPALFTSLKVASGTAVAVLFLAESFATTSGLGYLIMDAWGMGDVLSMFNAILGMSLLGLVIYGVIGLLERVCCPWLFAGRR